MALTDFDYMGNLALCRINGTTGSAEHPCDPRNPDDFYYYERMDDLPEQNDFLGSQAYTTARGSSAKNVSFYDYKSVKPGR